MSLTEVKSFYGRHVSNVACVIFAGRDRIVTFTEKNGTVGLPAGEVEEKKDLGVFKAMMREYREESGHSLPQLYHLRKYVWTHKNGSLTAIFAGKTDSMIKTHLGSRADGEIKAIRLTKISDFTAACKGRRNFKVRWCAQKSSLAAIRAYRK